MQALTRSDNCQAFMQISRDSGSWIKSSNIYFYGHSTGIGVQEGMSHSLLNLFGALCWVAIGPHFAQPTPILRVGARRYHRHRHLADLDKKSFVMVVSSPPDIGSKHVI